jgi:hypothetical protein
MVCDWPSIELIAEPAREAYQRDLDHLWYESVRLHANLHLLDEIARFRFDLFGEVDNLCWKLIINSLYDSTVLGIWKLVCDGRGDTHTISTIKKWIEEHGRDKSARRRLREWFLESPLTLVQDASLARVDRLRSDSIAHLRHLSAPPRTQKDDHPIEVP